MNTLDFLLQLAIILLAAKFLGLLMKKLGLPQVLGFILAGVLIGPSIWGAIFGNDTFEGWLFPIQNTADSPLGTFAEIGVVLVMFSAGLETDLKEIRRTGLKAFLIAMGGVLLPLALGFGVGLIFLPGQWMDAFFVGVILTATSVGITVETLKELGKLKSEVGTVIMSAAIIDDVIGIVILTIALSFGGSGGEASPILSAINPDGNPVIAILWMLVFFAVAVGLGFPLSMLFKQMEKRTPNTHRMPILSLAVCFVYAFLADRVFGVADITGAYIAGVILSTNHRTAEYVDKKIEVNSYVLFGPVFFANIGIRITFEGMDLQVLLFGLLFVLAGIAGKFIGCGGLSRAFGYSWRDSARIGVGMIARGEVALIVAQKGIDAGLIDARYLAVVVLLVLISSILLPILMKLLYRDGAGGLPLAEKNETPAETHAETVPEIRQNN